MSSNYLDTDQTALSYFSAFNPQNAAELDAKWPGKLQALCSAASGWVDSRIGKRYVRPVPNPPDIIRKLTAWLVEPEAFMALGIRPSDEQWTLVEKHFEFVHEQLKEIADAKDGLYDLPLSANDDSSGIVAPVTLGYSEQSPYTSRHKQYDAVAGNRRYG